MIGDTFRDDVSDGGQILGLVEIVPNKKWCPYSSCWVFLCISHLIHGNAIFDILESHAFQKCFLSTTLYLCFCVFVYFTFDTRECHI